MAYFNQLVSKSGETVSHYVHSWETSRDSTTNRKVSKWATAVEITAVVRSQPSMLAEIEAGVHETDYILILTKTAVVRLDVMGWKSKYYDVTFTEEMYWQGTIQYYKCHCIQRLEFLGLD